MIPLPEWAPNLHPLVIHFPIALLTSAVLIDLISLFTRKWQGVRISATVLFILGALGAVAAFLTGRAAADTVTLPTAAISTLSDHEDWALRTLVFFGIYAIVRSGMLWFDVKGQKWAQVWAHVALFLVGAAGLGLLVKTGDVGGELVYVHGLGVRAAQDNMAGMVHDVHAVVGAGSAAVSGVASAGIMAGEDGSWTWMPVPNASTLPEDFRFLTGSASNLHVAAGQDSALAMHVQGGPLLFVGGDTLEGVQVDAVVNLDQFDGTVRLVHHVHDAQNYDYLAYSEGLITQGRLMGGEPHIFDEKMVDSGGWISLRAVSSGTHFRGYVDGEPATHGHGSEPGSGPVGLYLDGSGTVMLKRISVASIR